MIQGGARFATPGCCGIIRPPERADTEGWVAILPSDSEEERVPTAEMDQSSIDMQLRKLESRRAILLVLGGAHVGRIVPLEAPELVFGRDAECDVCLPDDGISRRHAQVRARADGGWEVHDLGSTNGTTVNGVRIDVHPLVDGDRVVVGRTVLKYVADAGVMAEYQERMYEMSVRDPLTQLFNRRYFEDRLRTELAYAERHGALLSLLFLDIDHFKAVNDQHGHLAGDRVLAEVATVMRGQIRSEDVLARFGGEEFVILVRETPPAGAMVLAERIRTAVERQTVAHEEKILAVTVSIGAVTLRGGTPMTEAALVDAADKLLYRAKEAGRNRTCAEFIEGGGAAARAATGQGGQG
jgi:two-component system, cell cycle response regulator